MRKVLVSFEFSIAQSKEHPLIIDSPDFVFSGEFNKDDEKSFSQLCILEYKVRNLSHDLSDLGCQVAVIRKETSVLDF